MTGADLYRLRRGPLWARLILAAGLCLVAFLLRVVVLPVEEGFTYITFYPGVAVTVLLCGTGPALLFGALSMTIAAYVFAPPFLSFEGVALKFTISAVYTVSVLVIILTIRYFQRQADRTAAGLRAEIGVREALGRRLQESIEESEQRESFVRAILESSPDGVFISDADGRYVEVNGRGCELLGFSREELLSRRIDDVVAADDASRVPGEVAAVRSGGAHLAEWRFARKDGSMLEAEVHARVLPDGRLIGIVRDISARKRAESELREKQADLARAQIVGRIGSWKLDFRHDELLWSEENHRIFGIPEGTPLTYESFLATIHPDDREFVDRRWRAGLRGEPYDIEHRLVVDGRVKWVRERAELELGSDGKPVGAFGTTQDVTEKKLAADALAEARDAAEQANRAKSSFLANMSHEIRTPLHAIVGLGRQLRDDERDPRQHHRLDQLCATSDHLLALLSNVLDFSRIEAGRLTLHPGPFRLGPLVDEVTGMLEGPARGKGLTLSREVPDALADTILVGDRPRLAQVLVNLCGNAVKFTDHGSVCLGVAFLSEGPAGLTLRFSVRDTGCGISPGDLPLLFRPFRQADSSTTRPHGGTGLGLAISQQIVSAMGGEIRVETRAGEGSAFRFDVTFTKGEAPVAETAQRAMSVDLRGKRALVAEDHPLSRQILTEYLLALGFEVEGATNGAEAVEMARASRYDLILMDLQMPKLDGLAAARAIRELPEHARTPIVAVTANAFAEDHEQCLEAGMNGYLAKPFAAAALAAAVSTCLAARIEIEPAGLVGEEALAHALDAIADLRCDGPLRLSGAPLAAYAGLLRRFVDAQGDDLSRLRSLVESGDSAAAGPLAHSLRGTAALLGAHRVEEAALGLEFALKGGAPATAVLELAGSCVAALESLAESIRNLPGNDRTVAD